MGDDNARLATTPDEILKQLVSRLLTKDPKYLYCVMNSGLVEFIPRTTDTLQYIYYRDDYTFNESSSSTSGGRTIEPEEEDDPILRALVTGMGLDPQTEMGMCRLSCLGSPASSSCCDAAMKLQTLCRLSASSAQALGSESVRMLDAVFSLKNQCESVAASAVVLWVLAGMLVGLVGTLVVATRKLLYRPAKCTTINDQATPTSDLNESVEQAEPSTSSIPSTPTKASGAHWWLHVLFAWRQVSNLVWKNMQIKRTKPVAMVMEVVMPVLLTGALALIANVDTIFGGGGYYDSWYQQKISTAIATTPPLQHGFLCTEFFSPQDDGTSLGAPSETKQAFYTNGQTVVGLFLLIVYIKFVSRTAAMMVIEKESRIREIMKIMGLSDGAVVVSWVLTTSIFATPLAFAMAALLHFGHVFPQTSFMTVAWLLFLFSQSITAFGYFVTPFFNKSRTAAISSVVAWIVLYFPYFIVRAKPNSAKYAAALSPPTALGLAVDDMLKHAQLGTGTVYNIAIKRSPVTVPTALAMCGMLVLDCVLLYALGWYVDQVLPQEYGVARKWNFLFTRAYWQPAAHQDSTTTSGGGGGDGAAYMAVTTPSDGLRSSSNNGTASTVVAAVVEPVNGSLAAQERNGTCLQIHALRKVFVTDHVEKVAVENLSLTMYSGQITALLGHNGAGKTTLIAMLTGLTPPTNGDATLLGRSIRTDFDELRHLMGICPQHDVLLGELTVQDHLLFVGTMKHVPPQKLAQEVTKLIEEVGLVDKAKVQIKNLSGGQKRKLSVALAFIGDSKLVFLDEPTSGMDPYSRRFTWDLLQRNRDDRVIVLTTHFMDEADILGDRIAIMADGQLCCVGSSLFLKNRYGAGYMLTMLLTKSDGGGKGSGSGDALLSFLRQFVPEAMCLSNHGAEMVFQLPTERVSAFPSMLEALDDQLESLHVAQYGISVTTLEEVFLQIARDRETLVAASLSTKNENAELVVSVDDNEDKTATQHRAQPSLRAHFQALLTKRVRITKRDRKSLMNGIGLPLLLLLIAAVLPEIQMASILSDYTLTLPSAAAQANCTVTTTTTTNGVTFSRPTPQDYGCANDYNHCAMGIFKCDPQVCCSLSNPVSPFYPCATCPDAYYGGPCYNPQCVPQQGGKIQLILNSFLSATIISLAFAFVPAAIVAFIVKEKDPIQNATSLQLICGAKPLAYWLANGAHDLLVASVPVFVGCIVLPYTSRGLTHISMEEVVAVVALLVSFTLAVVPMAYVVSHRYDKHSSAQTALLVLGLVTGGALSIVSFLCRMIDIPMSEKPDAMRLSTLDKSYLRWIYLLFPSYALSTGAYEVMMHRVSHTSLLEDDIVPPSFFGLFPWLGSGDCSVECWDTGNTADCCVRGVFALDVAGASVLYGLLEAVLFMGILFLIERKRVTWKKPMAVREEHKEQEEEEEEEEEDSDVAKERHLVETSEPQQEDAVFIRNLKHQYKDGKTALSELSLRIPKGECFGYLGINGAGKSTTMKILTGQTAPTSGFASLGGYDLAKDLIKSRTVLGYCPQFDSLHDLLTVEEQLELYARLKGIPNGHVRNAVDQKILEVGLTEYRSKLTRGLSGGNKRKVSTAIALMGAPRIIFLDEPSTGVDPSSRRKMWDVIARVCAEKDSCVVLTTHSMEECEALSTRVGILVGGKLKCLGSVEHLKQKFGKGYTVQVKLRQPSKDHLDELRRHVVDGQDQEQAQEHERETHQELTEVNVTLSNLENVCEKLGDLDHERYTEIKNGDDVSAAVLTQMLRTDAFIPLAALCEWWATEDLGRDLVGFFHSNFAGTELVEQQGSDMFVFQVPKASLRPSVIFRSLETHKDALHIGEYNVSETSLEHIFNSMAAQQEEQEHGEQPAVAVLGGGRGGGRGGGDRASSVAANERGSRKTKSQRRVIKYRRKTSSVPIL